MLASIPQTNEEIEMHFYLKSQDENHYERHRDAYQVPLLREKRVVHVDVDLVDVSVPSLFSVESFLLQGPLYLE